METASLYRALADENRRRIIVLLLRHNCCVSALARALGISESAVSQHLRVLRQAMLLTGEKRGHFMHYSIDRERLRALARDIESLADISPEAEGACAESVRRMCHGSAGFIRLPMAPLPEKGK